MERDSFLHGLVTNDIKKLQPGGGCYAAWLTPKGRMLADLTVLSFEDHLLVDVDGVLINTLHELLGKYGPYHPVEIRNESAAEAVIHVAGPDSEHVLQRAGIAVPAGSSYAHVKSQSGWGQTVTIRRTRGVPLGFDVRIPVLAVEEASARLHMVGGIETAAEDLEAFRISSGLPRWGFELDENVLPDEAGLNRTAISYTKGCYIGQETVARIRTYGHVNRVLVGFRLPVFPAVVRDDEIHAAGAKTGKITSAGLSIAFPGRAALGYVGRDSSAPGTPVQISTADGEVIAEVLALPFAS